MTSWRHTEQPRALARVLEAFVAVYFEGSITPQTLLGPKRIDGNRGGKRAVDPARQAEDHAVKPLRPT